MTISLRAVGTTTAAAGAATGVTVGVPAGLTAADISILTVALKTAVAATPPTITTPTGWTLIGTVTNNGTGTAVAATTGNNTVGMYYRTGTYTAPTITTSGATAMGAVIVGYQTSIASGTWDVTSSTVGSDTTAGANGSITGAANLSASVGDWVLVGTGLSSVAGTISAETLAMTGATVGTRANRANLAVTTSNDVRMLRSDWPVTVGSSTAAPVYTWTNASSMTGHARLVRLREVAPAAPSAPVLNSVTAGTEELTAAWGIVTGASSYTVEYKKTADSTWTTAATGLTAVSHTITGLTDIVSYDVRVFAVGPGGPSVASNTRSATPVAPIVLLVGYGTGYTGGYGTRTGDPETPTGLLLTVVSSTRIDLSWNGVPGATGYDIERGGVLIMTSHPGTTYSDTGLTPGTAYNYRVRSVA